MADGAAILLDPAVEPPMSTADSSQARPARLDRLLPRQAREALRAGAWLFLALAGLQLVEDYYEVATWGAQYQPIMYLVLLGGLASILFPAAILLWRPDAWRSNRPLILGAALWTAPWVVAYLLERTLSVLSLDRGVAVQVVWTTPLVAGLLTVVGGLLLLIGLERLHTRRSRWPKPVVLAALALTAYLCVTAMQRMPEQDMYTGWTVGHVRWWLSAILNTCGPFIACVWLGGFLWSALSAVRAGDRPRSLWWTFLLASISPFLIAAGLYDVAALTSFPLPWFDNAVWDGVAILQSVSSVLLTTAFVLPAVLNASDPAARTQLAG